MERKHVEALFISAGIPVLRMYELMNQYWPPHYKDLILANPWWLVKTPLGGIEIGNRKRVASINWSDTPIRIRVTTDDVTVGEEYVHAWTTEKLNEYMTVLGTEFRKVHKAIVNTQTLEYAKIFCKDCSRGNIPIRETMGLRYHWDEANERHLLCSADEIYHNAEEKLNYSPIQIGTPEVKT